jgi:beta-lactamase superfamily II metal-dependent hydrolase
MKNLKTIPVLLFLILIAAAGCLPEEPGVSTSLSVHFIDVGQGDSILIDIGETEVLIDGGEKGSGAANYISAYVDGALEAMIATHPHTDHIGGLPAVLAAFEVKEVWLNGDTSTSQTFTDFMASVNAENATIYEAERGDSIQVGALTFSVLNPEKPLTMSTNNNSIVLSLSYGQIDFLFMGDAEKQAESSMLSLLSDIDVLKVGHHGSNTASSPAFLNIVKPDIAVYMAGVGNTYGHPHQETIDALNNMGAQIYGTDTKGTIIITTAGATPSVQTSK